MGSNQEIVFINNPVVLLDEVTRILDHGQMVRDSLAGSVKPATATFDNLIAPLQDATNLTASHLGPITILARVAADPALREAARQAELMIAAAQSTALMRTDIAALVAAVYGESRPNQSPFQGQRTSGEDDYLVAYMHGRYLRSGANIRETDVRERYTVAQQRLDKLLADARKTLTEDSGGVWFELDDLAGVPEKTLHSMKRQPQEEHENEEGTRRMLLRAELRKNHLAPVMRSARNEETRKKLYQAKETRFPANVGRLAEIVRLRHEIALLLGFRSHAELKMENMMHRSVADVQRVLEQTRDGLRSFAREEIAVMMRLKRGDDACAAELFSWDWAFYNQSLRRQHYAVDAQYASEFFEVTHTFEQMLRVFEALFGLRFKEAEGSSSTWHQDVTVYELWDASSEKEDKQLGKLYVDLFSREGKYDGASHVVLSPRFTERDGSQHLPSSALIYNFVKQQAPRPTLLLHPELRTMFHELGHGIHYLTSQSKYAIPFSQDFVEVPSLMLENFIWEPDVLTSISKHYSHLSARYLAAWQGDIASANERTEEMPPPLRLPQDLAQRIAATKSVNAAHQMLTQNHLALFDLEIHSRDGLSASDITNVWNTLKRDVIGLEDEDGAARPGQAGFGHIFKKYDAAYFGYVTSALYASDLYQSYFKQNPAEASSVSGTRYRKEFLEPGSSGPEADLLEKALGRAPSSMAYYDGLKDVPVSLDL